MSAWREGKRDGQRGVERRIYAGKVDQAAYDAAYEWKRAVKEALDAARQAVEDIADEVNCCEAALDDLLEAPIPMLLWCPACRAPHVDTPDVTVGWTNPPHRTHQCQQCGQEWRPALVATTGVLELP